MIENWNERTNLLLGDEAMERLRQAHVLVDDDARRGRHDNYC